MSLVELTVEDLRCLQRVELTLDPRHNLIWGSNGSGKTSLLEVAEKTGLPMRQLTEVAGKLVAGQLLEVIE